MKTLNAADSAAVAILNFCSPSSEDVKNALSNAPTATMAAITAPRGVAMKASAALVIVFIPDANDSAPPTAPPSFPPKSLAFSEEDLNPDFISSDAFLVVSPNFSTSLVVFFTLVLTVDVSNVTCNAITFLSVAISPQLLINHTLLQ